MRSSLARATLWAGLGAAGALMPPGSGAAPPPDRLPVAPGATQAPQVELLERVVAVIDGHPLLLSDERALAAVRGLDEKAALRAAEDEQLMYTEASRLQQAEVQPGEEEEASRKLLASKPDLALRVPGPDLRRLLRRELVILKYVEFRFRPQVRVSDEQVRKAWETEEVGRPSGVALEDAQDEIRARLERQALDERIEAWIGELRSRAEIREIAP